MAPGRPSPTLGVRVHSVGAIVPTRRIMRWFPLLGAKRLDAITSEDIQRVKHHLRERAPKTVNNVITVLNVLLKKAVEWDVIERVPCRSRLLPIPRTSARFLDFEEYERLVAATEAEPNANLVVLLGGEAGLRCGEIMALEWTDVDLANRQICVQRSEWRGHVTVPKGGRLRHVPLTTRFASALRNARHLRGRRVICALFSQREVQSLVQQAARRANLTDMGVHVLRHPNRPTWRRHHVHQTHEHRRRHPPDRPCRKADRMSRGLGRRERQILSIVDRDGYAYVRDVLPRTATKSELAATDRAARRLASKGRVELHR